MSAIHGADPLAEPSLAQHRSKKDGDHSQPRDSTVRRDWSLILAITLTAVAGIAVLVWSYHDGLILAYWDSQSHLNIARRVLDSRTPGIAQLGTVWLPVPHILMLPFIWIDSLWHTGLAGSIVGLLCFVATAATLFLSIRLITGHEAAAWIGLVVFLSNPNVLYIQTTPLTEPVLLMSMTASAYYLLKWSQHNTYTNLIMAGLLAVLAVGSRYDGWFFAAVSGLVVLLTAYLRSHDPGRAEGVTLAYAAFPVYATFLWVFYNWLIFGDPLAFQRGEFSAQFQQEQVAQAGALLTKHNIVLSVQTYTWAVIDNVGWLVLGLSVIGVLVHIRFTRFRHDGLVPYLFLSPYPFNILALWLGQTVIQLPQSEPPGYFNVRYGLIVLPGLAIFIGYLYSKVAARVRGALILSLALILLLVQTWFWIPDWPHSVPIVAEGLNSQATNPELIRAAEYLGNHYGGGGILIDDTQPHIIMAAHIDMREYVATFSGKLWREALAHPSLTVHWIVMNTNNHADRVVAAVRDNPSLQNYTLVYEDHGVEIYRRNSDQAMIP